MFKPQKVSHYCAIPKSKPVQKWGKCHLEHKTIKRLTTGQFNKNISIVNDIIILMLKIVATCFTIVIDDTYDHYLVL
jgi:hypothetical protein